MYVHMPRIYSSYQAKTRQTMQNGSVPRFGLKLLIKEACWQTCEIFLTHLFKAFCLDGESWPMLHTNKTAFICSLSWWCPYLCKVVLADWHETFMFSNVWCFDELLTDWVLFSLDGGSVLCYPLMCHCLVGVHVCTEPLMSLCHWCFEEMLTEVILCWGWLCLDDEAIVVNLRSVPGFGWLHVCCASLTHGWWLACWAIIAHSWDKFDNFLEYMHDHKLVEYIHDHNMQFLL